MFALLLVGDRIVHNEVKVARQLLFVYSTYIVLLIAPSISNKYQINNCFCLVTVGLNVLFVKLHRVLLCTARSCLLRSCMHAQLVVDDALTGGCFTSAAAGLISQ